MKKLALTIFFALSAIILANNAHAFLYPVGPVFDPLNIGGEAAGTIPTALNKVTTIKSTVNNKIEEAKKMLADTIAGALGGKRKPGKVPGAKQIMCQENLDYLDEETIRQKVHDYFWTFPDPEKANDYSKQDEFITKDKAEGYVLKRKEFYQDGLTEVWAAARGLEEELKTIKTETENLKEQIVTTDDIGLNDQWKNVYEAYKAYDALYALIEEMTAMRAMLMMTKAIRYDAEPVYRSQIQSNLMTYKVKNAFAMQDFFKKAPKKEMTSAPFYGKEDMARELAVFTQIARDTETALDYHNTMQTMPEYKNLFIRYKEMKKLHQKAVEMLNKSDQCAITFLGRYYRDPIKLWSGRDLSQNPTDHVFREGLSGWAYNGLFVAAKAKESDETEAKYTTINEEGTTQASDNPSIVQPTLSSGASSARPAETVIETDAEGIITNEIEQEEMDYESDANEDEAKDLADKSEESFTSDDEKEKAEADIRKTKQLYWDIGFQTIQDLLQNPNKWNAGIKNLYPVWTDQKIFYYDYITLKYANIKELLTNLDFTPEVEEITQALIKDKGEYFDSKEIEYNSISASIIRAINGLLNAQEATLTADYATSAVNAKSEKTSKMYANSQTIVTKIDEFNLKIKNFDSALSRHIAQQESNKNSISAIKSKYEEVSKIITEAFQAQDQVLDNIETASNIKDLPEVAYINNLEPQAIDAKTIVSSQDFDKAVSKLNSYVAQIASIKASIETTQAAIDVVIKELSDIFEKDYKNAVAGKEIAESWTIESNQARINSLLKELEGYEATITKHLTKDIPDIEESAIEAAVNSEEYDDYLKEVALYKQQIEDISNMYDGFEEKEENYKDDITDLKTAISNNQMSIANSVATLRANLSVPQELGISSEAVEKLTQDTNKVITQIEAISAAINSSAYDIVAEPALSRQEEMIQGVSLALQIAQLKNLIAYNSQLDTELNAIKNINTTYSQTKDNASNLLEELVETASDEVEDRIENVYVLNDKAIANINSYTENRVDGSGNIIAAEPLRDIVTKVEKLIEESKPKVVEIIDRYLEEIELLPLESFRAENHEDIKKFHTDMFNEIEAITIDVPTIATESKILLYYKLYQEALTRLSLSGLEGENKIIDTDYFVGAYPKSRDTRIPAVPPHTYFIDPRELVYFDEVSWVISGGFDKKVTKEKFLENGSFIPKIWQYMLKDKAFVETDFDVDKYLEMYGKASVDNLRNLGRYPCYIKNGSKKFAVSITGQPIPSVLKEFLSNKKFFKNVKFPPAFTYILSPLKETDTFDYPLCDIEKSIALIPKANPSRNECPVTYYVVGDYGLVEAGIGVKVAREDLPEEYYDIDTSDIAKHIMLKAASTKYLVNTDIPEECHGISEKEALKSELAVFLQSTKEFADYSNMIFSEADYKKRNPKSDENDSVKTFEDFVAENMPYKINQVGDFLRVAEEEAELRKSVDELAAQIEIVKWGEKDAEGNKTSYGLYDKLIALGLKSASTSSFSIDEEEDYNAAFAILNEGKHDMMDLAIDSALIDVTLEEDENGEIINKVAENRKKMYTEIVRALRQDEDAVINLSDSPPSWEELRDEIIKEKVDRAANGDYQTKVSEEMAKQAESFKDPFCAAY